jgi:predicted nucleotidyltransferase
MNQTTPGEIHDFVNKVAQRFKPHKIILFGSHAANQATPGSDVDLLVVMEFEGRPQLQALNIRRQLKRKFPLDLIVRRPSDIQYRLAEGDFFLKDIFENGKVLYERAG